MSDVRDGKKPGLKHSDPQNVAEQQNNSFMK